MLDVQIGREFDESIVEMSGDAKELATDILNIMAAVYDQFLHSCPCCPPVFKDIFTDEKVLKDMFNRVDKQFNKELKEAGYSSYEEFVEDMIEANEMMDEDLEIYKEDEPNNNIVDFRPKIQNKKDDMKLFGLEEFKKDNNKNNKR